MAGLPLCLPNRDRALPNSIGEVANRFEDFSFVEWKMAQSRQRQSKKHQGHTGAEADRTKDRDVIRKWAEDRGGHPSVVQDTEILRIDFDEPGGNDDALDRISWDDFFKIFDDRDLTFLYQEKTAEGKQSRFNKFVRGSEEEEG